MMSMSARFSKVAAKYSIGWRYATITIVNGTIIVLNR